MPNGQLQAILSVLLFFVGTAAGHAQNPPSADRVFQLSVTKGAEGALLLNWRIAPGNYLYRDKIKVTSGQGNSVEIHTSPGQMKDDPSFGVTEIYHGDAQAAVSARSLRDLQKLTVSYQGCAEQGICYPPVTKVVDLETMSVVKSTGPIESAPASYSNWVSDPHLDQPREPASASAEETSVLQGNFAAMLAAFVGFGLLLAFTPCVFPMIPILSGMLAQAGERLTVRRGFALSGTYVLAMALAYAALGIVVAWSGQNLQAALQTPLALGLMSAIFVALAFSMFGFYDLQLPQSWQTRLIGAGTHRGGSLSGAAIMGFGSALIVGPCVTPPLAAALVFVAQTGNVARGASALFALGIGMGLPLLAFGTFGASVLPRSGPWLARVKHAFGFIFIGLAIWIASRLLPTWAAGMLWGASLAGAGVFLAVPQLLKRAWALGWSAATVATGILSLAVGILLIAGSASEPSGVLGRFTGFPAFAAIEPANAAGFETVTTPQALDGALARARQLGKPVLLDFSAGWCVECKLMDRTVFSDKSVQRRLADFALIRADATDYNDATRALMKKFGVIGPPTVIFLGAHDAAQSADNRIIGPVGSATFLRKLDQFQSN